MRGFSFICVFVQEVWGQLMETEAGGEHGPLGATPAHVTHQGEGLLGPRLGDSLETSCPATYPDPSVLSSEAWGPRGTQFETHHPGEKLPFPERRIPRHSLQELWIHFLPPTTSNQAPSSPTPWTCALHGWHLLNPTRLRWPRSVEPLE